jgi:HD-like signal output (HDOD) protein/CheY-like chemotaxis protein
MRVLFVDDEPKVLQGIERAFLCDDSDWEILTAGSGKLALELLASEPIDVVVSDIRMPSMDGSELLRRVCEQYPQCVRMVLSGQADEAASMRLVNVAHQFLSKPCSPDGLKQALGRALLMRSLMDNHALRTLVGRVDKLPVAPLSFRQLSAVLERPNASPRDVAAIVARDPVLTAKVLHLVNSSFFTRAEPIVDVLPAVTRLGLRVVRYVALQVGVFAQVKDKRLPIDVAALQAECVRASELARRLVSARADQESAAAAALLADLGILVMATTKPEAWRDTPAPSGASGAELDAETERQAFGCTHQEVSAYLLALWGLPDSVTRAVLAHHDVPAVASEQIDVRAAVMLGHALIDGRVLPAAWAELPAVASVCETLQPARDATARSESARGPA